MTRNRRPSPQTAAVLEALGEAGTTWSHGYELCRQLGLSAGTMYPILARLAERGLLETSWEEPGAHGRPPRHRYRLTAEGELLVAGLRSAPQIANLRVAGVSA